jgi:hypothetical protein
MKVAIILYTLIFLTLVSSGCSATKTTTMPTTEISTIGSLPSNAAPVGVTVAGIIECGAGYTSHELYDVRVSFLEVVRGEKALTRIQQANPSVSPTPNVGYEYVVARVKFDYAARGAPGDCCHQLTSAQFVAFSIDGKEYQRADVAPPVPELKGRICAGNSLEGWIVLQLPKDDRKPVAMFDASIGGLEGVEHGGNIWFQLF